MRFGAGVPPFATHVRSVREPMSYDPEGILARAHFGAEQATAFLFENFLEGLRDDAVEDAAIGTAYLSDAALLARGGHEGVFLGGGGGGGSGGGGNIATPLMDGDGVPADPGAIGELVAGSLATRGLLSRPRPADPRSAVSGAHGTSERAGEPRRRRKLTRGSRGRRRRRGRRFLRWVGRERGGGGDPPDASRDCVVRAGGRGEGTVPPGEVGPAGGGTRGRPPGRSPGYDARRGRDRRLSPPEAVGGHAIGGADVVDRRVGGAALAGEAGLAPRGGPGRSAPPADQSPGDEVDEDDDDIEEW